MDDPERSYIPTDSDPSELPEDNRDVHHLLLNADTVSHFGLDDARHQVPETVLAVNWFCVPGTAPREALHALLTQGLHQKQLTSGNLAFVTSAGALCRALGTAPTCMAADLYGNKHALLGATSLVLLAFLLLFLHFSPETVVIAAVMLGLGSNAPLVLGHLAVHELTEGVAHAQSASFAAFGHAVRLGTVVGLVLAGVATIHYGYIAGTFMQVVLSAAAVAWGVYRLPEMPPRSREEWRVSPPPLEQWLHWRRECAAALTKPVVWCLVATSGTSLVFYGMLFQGLPMVCQEHCPQILRSHNSALVVAACLVVAPLVAASPCRTFGDRFGQEPLLFASAALTMVLAAFFAVATSPTVLLVIVLLAGACHGVSVSAASTSLSEGMASPSQLKYMVCVSTLLLDVWKALGVMLVEYGTVFVGFSFTYYLQGLLLLLQMVYMAYSAGGLTAAESEEGGAKKSLRVAGAVHKARGRVARWGTVTLAVAVYAARATSLWTANQTVPRALEADELFKAHRLQPRAQPLGGSPNEWPFQHFYTGNMRASEKSQYDVSRAHCDDTDKKHTEEEMHYIRHKKPKNFEGTWTAPAPELDRRWYKKDFKRTDTWHRMPADWEKKLGVGVGAYEQDVCAAIWPTESAFRRAFMDDKAAWAWGHYPDQWEVAAPCEYVGVPLGGKPVVEICTVKGRLGSGKMGNWLIQRLGPFTTTGGEYVHVANSNVGNLREMIQQYGWVWSSAAIFNAVDAEYFSDMGAEIRSYQQEFSVEGVDGQMPLWSNNGDSTCSWLPFEQRQSCRLESVHPNAALMIDGVGVKYNGIWTDARPPGSEPLQWWVETGIRVHNHTEFRASRVIVPLGFPGTMDSPPLRFPLPVDEESCLWGTVMASDDGELLAAFTHGPLARFQDMWIFAAEPEMLGLNFPPLIIEDIHPSAVYVPSRYGLTNERLRKLMIQNIALHAHRETHEIKPLCKAIRQGNITDKDSHIALHCNDVFKFRRGQVFTIIAFYDKRPGGLEIKSPTETMQSVVTLMMRWKVSGNTNELSHDNKLGSSINAFPTRTIPCADCTTGTDFSMAFCGQSIRHALHCLTHPKFFLVMSGFSSKLEYYFGLRLWTRAVT